MYKIFVFLFVMVAPCISCGPKFFQADYAMTLDEVDVVEPETSISSLSGSRQADQACSNESLGPLP